ncbi:hypothetical protein [Thermoactinomyces mirandus]|uniref:Uncharacterized protein n=1 Tax=Thermoactinomyces mirandus TaxID=2756294 RepID=A0A7W1XPU7_9BACL|nr:hypothetical protein [Thermoactinomyces mirandus]MBA4601074.1 hypothetical protein [Thermoactinomyces mirandus]
MVKKRTRQKQKRVAEVGPHGVLVRDLKATALWMGTGLLVIALLVIIERTLL